VNFEVVVMCGGIRLLTEGRRTDNCFWWVLRTGGNRELLISCESTAPYKQIFPPSEECASLGERGVGEGKKASRGGFGG